MSRPRGPSPALFTVLVVALASAAAVGQQSAARGTMPGPRFRFRTGVELINVTATVTDSRGRFVGALHQEDFRIYEDGRRQPVTHFSADRVPVSLGLVVDASSSMEGDKWRSAMEALDGFLSDLRDPADEIFLYAFNASPELVREWTNDLDSIRRALDRIGPNGGTALLDAVAEAVPLAQTGRNRKKAVVVISDGNDTGSHFTVTELRELIRGTDVLVYAVGIDGAEVRRRNPAPPVFRPPVRLPIPFPGGRRAPLPIPPAQPRIPSSSRSGAGVDVNTLREITDDSGGRTELVRSARDLEPATAGIADELGRQYYLGYTAATPRDGRWHTIRVETRDPDLRVRARRGYVAAR